MALPVLFTALPDSLDDVPESGRFEGRAPCAASMKEALIRRSCGAELRWVSDGALYRAASLEVIACIALANSDAIAWLDTLTAIDLRDCSKLPKA